MVDTNLKFGEFTKKHDEQVASRSQKDVFMIWIILMFLAVIAAHFLITLSSGGITGAVIGPGDSSIDAAASLVAAIGIVIAAALVGGAGYYSINSKVK